MKIYLVGPDREIKGGIGTLMSILCKEEDNFIYLNENSKSLLISIVNTITVLLRIVLSSSDDIFHFNVSIRNNIDRVYVFVIFAHIFKRKYIVHSHWFEVPDMNSSRGRKFHYIYYNAQHAIFLSSYWKNIFFSKGFFARNHSVIHNCADTGNLGVKGASNNAFVFVGSLTKRKGVDVLLDAYQHYRSVVTNPKKLILVGSKLKNSDLEIREIPGLELWGEKSNKHVNDCIASSYCLVLPSLSEGVPIVVIEALLHCTPVITSNTYGLESVLPSVSPFLVDYGDHIGLCEKMIQVEQLIDEQQDCFEEAARVFNTHRFKNEFSEVYEKVVLSA
jgi:glycosyltransferase involved in cell wall biosynthesis